MVYVQHFRNGVRMSQRRGHSRGGPRCYCTIQILTANSDRQYIHTYAHKWLSKHIGCGDFQGGRMEIPSQLKVEQT